MTRYFDKTTKCSFRDPADPHFIRFGSARDRDPKLKIAAGKLRLEGCACLFHDIISLFAYCKRRIRLEGQTLLPSSNLPSNVSSMVS
jgi:hypothetical protein